MPGYSRLKNFWQSLPTNDASGGCNLQGSYITWLDTPYSGLPEVKQLQNYVTQLKRAYRVNTELYSTAQLETYYKTYSPHQTRAKVCVHEVERSIQPDSTRSLDVLRP